MALDLTVIQHRISDGDVQALKALHDSLAMQLLELASGITGNHPQGEEVVQDVFVSLWQKRRRLLRVTNLQWYLYACTRNRAIHYLRKQKQPRTLALDENKRGAGRLQVETTPEDLMVTEEVIRRVNAAINALPPRCRLVFKMVKEDGLTYREVAALLDLSLKTVENQMGIALKKLHKAIAMDIPARGSQKEMRL